LKKYFVSAYPLFSSPGHIFGRGPSKDHSIKVWLQLAQWFLRRRLKCEMLTDGRKVMAKTLGKSLWQGELKMLIKICPAESKKSLQKSCVTYMYCPTEKIVIGDICDTTLCDQVCQWLATGWWFSPVTLLSSTNKL
jgi:hypothetical protein